jgi:hypothetical protein
MRYIYIYVCVCVCDISTLRFKHVFNCQVWRPRLGRFKEYCDGKNSVGKWSYYPDTSTEELKSTKNPLKAQLETSDRNLKRRPPERARKIISTRPNLLLLLKLFCRHLYLKSGYKELIGIRIRFPRASTYHEFQFSH